MPNLPAQELRFAIQRLGRRIRLMQANSEVTESQRAVIFTLFNDGPQSLSSLAESEHVSPPSMNRTVNLLADLGFVSRESDDDDGRKIAVTLTDAGAEFVEETRRRRDAWFARRLDTLSVREQKVLEQATPILQKLIDE
ncbi:MAG TPA: MarR family transcriptional regulator [Terrimesophilobacter sp.]|nr:MarR family transcriptional regulator [Terrimesophilobacter sp.]